MSSFKVGDVLKINPDFVSDLKNRKIPGFSPTEGWLPEFVRDFINYTFNIISFKNTFFEMICNTTGTNVSLQLEKDGKLFSAPSGPPLMMQANVIKEIEPSDFCICGDTPFTITGFTTSYKVCKVCGKEKR
jgi:hypothetical protein